MDRKGCPLGIIEYIDRAKASRSIAILSPAVKPGRIFP
jgi:hypothetical protein